MLGVIGWRAHCPTNLHRRASENPSGHLLTQVLNAEIEDDSVMRKLTRTDVLTYTSSVVDAGNETTTRSSDSPFHVVYLSVRAPHLITKLRGWVTVGPTEPLFSGVVNQPP